MFELVGRHAGHPAPEEFVRDQGDARDGPRSRSAPAEAGRASCYISQDNVGYKVSTNAVCGANSTLRNGLDGEFAFGFLGVFKTCVAPHGGDSCGLHSALGMGRRYAGIFGSSFPSSFAREGSGLFWRDLPRGL